MCGISGIVSKNIIQKKEIFEMNRVIRHRGPDDEGFVFFDSNFNSISGNGNIQSISTSVSSSESCSPDKTCIYGFYNPSAINFNNNINNNNLNFVQKNLNNNFSMMKISPTPINQISYFQKSFSN